jgi:hypothetical protein
MLLQGRMTVLTGSIMSVVMRALGLAAGSVVAPGRIAKAAGGANQGAGPTAESALSAEGELTRAMRDSDADGIERSLSDDWAVISARGGVGEGKSIFLGAIKAGYLTHKAYETSEPRVRHDGNVALVTTKVHNAGISGDALDEISNGGILVFNATSSIVGQVNPLDLKQNYGNADYDTRHYLNGNYLYMLPYFRGPRAVTAGWELSGTLFLHTGLPFSATESDYVAAAGNVGGVNTVQVASTPGTSNHCGSSAARTACLIAASFPNAGGFSSIFAPFDRNQFTGPGYFDTDVTLAKSVPLHEGVSVKLGVSAYNLFNHPNFATPVANVISPQFGQSLSTVSPPTSIYGAGLGGDASVRIVQLTGKCTF